MLATAEIGHNSGNRVRCIFRAHGDRGYTKLRNAFLQDRRISDETRGLVARLLSLPDDWEVTVQSIIASGKAGRDKVYRMIKEAELYGYIKPERERSDEGKFNRQLYLVSDDPEVLIQRAALEILALEDAKERHDYAYPAVVEGTTYVYVLSRDGLCKVGLTKSPKQRVAALNSQEGGNAEPCFFHATDPWSANVIERMAYFALKGCHVQGEWFKCTPEEAENAIKQAISNPLPGNPEVDREPLPGNPSTEAVPLPDFPDTGCPLPANRTHKRNIEDKINIYPKDLLSNEQARMDDKPPKPKRSKASVPDQYTYDFEEFWKVYPRREGKGEAFRQWQKLTMDQKRRAYVALKEQLPILLSKAREARGNFCPLPATWINQGRFDDELQASRQPKMPSPIGVTIGPNGVIRGRA